MPLYEYRCADCEHQFERMRPYSQADAPAACPECSSEQTERLLSRFCAHTGGAEPGSASASSGGACAGCSASTCAGCSR